MKNKKEVTQEEIKLWAENCRYCEKKEIKYFCVECWFAVCEKCYEEESKGKCAGNCFDDLPDLGDISIFKIK